MNRGGKMNFAHDVAQICLNGHVITRSVHAHSQFKKDFCPDCGSKTILHCPNCDHDIQGDYPGVHSTRTKPAPVFCYNCGHPFPWTSAKLAAAQELTDELEELTDDEKELVKSSLDEMARRTPRQELAASRFKRILAKVKGSRDFLYRLGVDIASEAIKKIRNSSPGSVPIHPY